MNDVFKTITAPSEGVYKEKGSRFMAFAFPVSTEEQIRKILDELKDKYYDARHHCYAWQLGAEGTVFRANDDGEPSSTAGKPILGQIRSNGLTDILIVVVRYFGGIKLGVPGLINAYREAASAALSNAVVKEKTLDAVFRIRFDYLEMNSVMRIIKEETPDVVERSFDSECEMLLSIRQKNMPRLRARLEKVKSLSFPDEK